MNYRHQFHAGNFADVFKHTLLLELVRRMQAKEKGFLFLDTHAGRGAYDLAAAERGDTLARQPEWPHGIGRIEATRPDSRPQAVEAYLAAVQRFREEGTPTEGSSPPRAHENLPYPGSPWLVLQALRAQDRMVLCERHPEEHEALENMIGKRRRVRVECTDGYAALRAHLPPLERRALVLIDPPYEAADEFEQVRLALAEGLRRLPGATFAVWYPLTDRADVGTFLDRLAGASLPPTLVAEVLLAGPDAPLKLRGCGLLILNPPWQLDRELAPLLPWIASTLARGPGASGTMRWLVPD